MTKGKQERKRFEEFVVNRGNYQSLEVLLGQRDGKSGPDFETPAKDKLIELSYNYGVEDGFIRAEETSLESYMQSPELIKNGLDTLGLKFYNSYRDPLKAENIDATLSQIPEETIEKLVLVEAKAKEPLFRRGMSENEN